MLCDFAWHFSFFLWGRKPKHLLKEAGDTDGPDCTLGGFPALAFVADFLPVATRI